MRGSAKLGVAGAVVAVVLLLAWWQLRPEPEPEEAEAPVAGAEVAPAADAQAEKAEAPAAETEAAAETAAESAEPVSPVLDVVRVDPDGQTVIAGRAVPGQEVEILLDGEVIGTVAADAGGGFATVLELPPSRGAREMALRTDLGTASDTALAVASAPASKEGAAREPAPQGESAADTAGTAEPAGADSSAGQFAVSAPVIILPQQQTGEAPVLVQPGADDVTLLQPARVDPGTGIVLDRITYSHQGDLIAAGRGEPGITVRVYVNAEFIAQVRCDEAGQWRVRLAAEVAANARLLRFDAVDAAGNVVSRLETPFEYSPIAATQEVRQRKIEVQKGDYLWKFAEQYYGEGWRYSVIFSANSALIRDPDLIYPGQVFTIPELVGSQ